MHLFKRPDVQLIQATDLRNVNSIHDRGRGKCHHRAKINQRAPILGVPNFEN
jgi:hypothetical protein